MLLLLSSYASALDRVVLTAEGNKVSVEGKETVGDKLSQSSSGVEAAAVTLTFFFFLFFCAVCFACSNKACGADVVYCMVGYTN